MVMPGALPLDDVNVRTKSIHYLPQGWDPVVERDVDGERAETTEIESRDTRLGSIQACSRSARAKFLGSAPTTSSQLVRGLELERIVLGVAQPGQQVGIYKDALRRLGDRLHYLNSANNRFWFDIRPNLRREMEERKRRFLEKEDAAKELDKVVAEDQTLDVEKVSILAADVSDVKKWSIQEIGWKEIAVALMKTRGASNEEKV